MGFEPMTKARAFAMSKQCMNRGGDCNCLRSCKAKQALTDLSFSLSSELKSIEERLRWLLHEPCTVREDWKMPEKPDGDYRLVVHHDGDGWLLHWYSETEQNDCIDIAGEDSWPFVEDTAWADDWEKLGIEVV